MAHEVFISHSSKDKLTADAICHALEQSGVSCWIAPRDVRPGHDYPAEIIYGIENCKLMVLIFSESSNNSRFVYAEIERAFSKGKMIIPYRISQVEMNRNLELILSGKHWIDAYPNDRSFTELTRAVKLALGMTPDSLSPETRENKTSEKSKPPVPPKKTPPKPISRKPGNISNSLKWGIPVAIVAIIVIVTLAIYLKKEGQMPVEYPTMQSEEYQNNVEEEGVISYVPSGTLTIKTTSGEEYNAILNTVSGLPVSFYKNGIEHKLTLDTFCRAKFTYQDKDDFNKIVTIRTYDEKNKEAFFIENYEFTSYSGLGTISFLTDKGMRFLSLNHVEQMTKEENLTPKMPKNYRPIYIRAGGMVYKIPQSLLKYEYRYYSSSEDYYGIPHCGGDIFITNELKYIRICKEVDGFGYETIYANVYFTDNSMISTCLLPGFLNTETSLGKIRSQVTEVDEIFWGNYDVDFAKRVAKDVWDGSKLIPFTGKGIATVYKTDGTNSIFALNSLGAIGGGGGSSGGYFSKTPTAYLNYCVVNHTENGSDSQILFFSEVKSLSIKSVGKDLVAEYLLYSGETGIKHIPGSQLEGLTEKGKERIDWINVEKIDFDKNRNVDLSQLKKVVITDKKGCVFETIQSTLYFGYSAGWGTQTVDVEGGLSMAYDKIKKIEILPTKQDGDKTRYPAKITLRSGITQELTLNIGGYYNDYLQFWTSMGGFSLNLRNDVQSIEFM
ncbi:MAG: toll/interleukin-1 receptor domain-containing protein [Tannerella sp.]|jgi:hypothetical protein|nr:toll/interleukin-1 receptor domain-containing protein [Tannerella sp.]